MDLIGEKISVPPAVGPVKANEKDDLLPFLKRNMICFLSGAGIFGLGWGIAQVPTNPLLIKKLNVDNTFFGIIGTLTGIFSIIGPILAPLISSKFVRKKWIFFGLHQCYVTAPAMIGLAILMCDWLKNYRILPALIMIFLLQWSCVPSLFQIPKAEYIGQTISKQYLGRYYGLDGSIAPIISLAGTFIAGYLLAGDPRFSTYGWALLLGYGIAQVGGILYLFAHEEPVSYVDKNESASLKNIIVSCWQDTSYRPFLVFFFLLCILRAPFSFVPLYGFKSLAMPSSAQAIFIIVISVAQFASATPSGWMCDKWGSGKTLGVGLAVQIVTIIPLCFFKNAFGVYAYLGIDAASMMITQVAGLAFILRYAPVEKRGLYVAGYWMIQALAAVIVTTPFAFMLDKFSYGSVFWIWSGLHLLVLGIVLEATRRGVTTEMFRNS